MNPTCFYIALSFQKREQEEEEEEHAQDVRMFKVDSKLGSKKIVNSFVVAHAKAAHARKRVRRQPLHGGLSETHACILAAPAWWMRGPAGTPHGACMYADMSAWRLLP